MRSLVLRRFLAFVLALCAHGAWAEDPTTVTPPVRVGAVPAGTAIAIVPVGEIPTFKLYTAQAGVLSGLFGSFASNPELDQRAQSIRQSMAQQKFITHEALSEALWRELRAAGYNVRYLAPGQPAPAPGERVLVTAPTSAGFWAGIRSSFQPFVRGRVILYGDDRAAPMRDAYYAAGFSPPVGHWIRASIDGPGVQTPEELSANTADTLALMKRAVDLFAKAVASEIREPGVRCKAPSEDDDDKPAPQRGC